MAALTTPVSLKPQLRLLSENSAFAMPVHDAGDIERSIDDFAGSQNGGLVVLPDFTTNNRRAQIVALAARDRLPAIYAFQNFSVREGGLMSMGVDVRHLFQNAANYIDRILKGA